MSVLFIGAGALGSYFGGQLIQAGLPVTFLVRSRRYEHITQGGLVVHSVHGDFRLQPQLIQDVTTASHYDLVFLAVKSYHLSSLWPALDQLVNQGSTLVPLLNGVAHLDQLLDRYGAEHVLGGLCYIEATLQPNGIVEQTSAMQEVVVGSLSGVEVPSLLTVQKAFAKRGVTFTQSTSIRADMWVKYLFLVVLSAATTLFQDSIGNILADNHAAKWVSSTLDETISVANAAGIKLPDDIADRIWNRIIRVAPTMTSSMFKDAQRGYPLEVEHLQGYLVRQAWQQGLQIPRMETVYWALRPFESGRDIAKSRG